MLEATLEAENSNTYGIILDNKKSRGVILKIFKEKKLKNLIYYLLILIAKVKALENTLG